MPVDALQLNRLTVDVEVPSGQPELVFRCRGVPDFHGTYAEVGACYVHRLAMGVLQCRHQDVSVWGLGVPRPYADERDGILRVLPGILAHEPLYGVAVQGYLIYVVVDGACGLLLAHVAYLGVQPYLSLPAVGGCRGHCQVAYLLLGHGGEVGAAEDAGQAEHVLCLKERAVAAAVYFHGKGVVPLPVDVWRDVEGGCVAAVLAEPHVLSVDPQVEETVHSVEVDVHVPALPVLGYGEGAPVRAYLVGVLVCRPSLVLGLSHDTLPPVVRLHLVIEDDGLVDVYGHSVFHGAVCLQSLYVPASGHGDVVPRTHVVVRLVKVGGPFLGAWHPVEFPCAVEAAVVGAAVWKHVLCLFYAGKGEHVRPGGFLALRQGFWALPLGAVRLCHATYG